MCKLQGKRLGCCLIATTFRIYAKCTHLILNFSENLIWRSRSLDPNILHALEFLSQVFFYCLYEEVQVLYVATRGLLVTRACSADIDASFGIAASALLNLLVLLAHSFLKGLLFALVIR